jgi:hypothetical protein
MDYQLTTTGGTVTTSGSTGSTVDFYYNPWPYGAPYIYYGPTEPTTCMGKAHVFECEHEPKCKCGAVERVMAGKKSGGKKKC